MNVPGVHAARAVVLQSVGWCVLVVGIIMIPAPGPGLLVTVLGLAILQRYNAWARRMMAPLKLRAVRGAAEWRRGKIQQSGGIVEQALDHSDTRLTQR